MTRMLASVADAGEALRALAGGADIIDLKDPARGALAGVDPATVQDTVARIAGRRPVSAVAGEGPMDVAEAARATEAVITAGADFVKLGLYPDAGPDGGPDGAGSYRSWSHVPAASALPGCRTAA